MIKKRNYKNKFTVRAKYTTGGGATNVEEKQSMSVNEMYARMIKTGEWNEAQKLKSNNHGSIERADKLMESALPAPLYMETGKRQEILNKMADVNDKLQEQTKINKKKSEVKKAVDRELSKLESERL